MKKALFLLSLLLVCGCTTHNKPGTPVNGIMIDCARLLEKQDYYYRLIDFMSEWNMNTLLLHFSDDHGLSVALPGFEKLAHPRAFTPREIKKLVRYGRRKGIDIIPELEVFGHTRYITDHPDYDHLYVGDRSEKIVFNAVDPLNPETLILMRSMISEVASLFPSRYLHLGCDEVNLSGLGLNDKEREAAIWSDYVNKMISIARDNGKIPMIWSDHVRKDPRIAEMLDKDVVLVEWNYSPDYKPSGLDDLNRMGFTRILMAPSVSCWRNRVIPTMPQLRNVNAHATALRDSLAGGMINTIWLPMRYLQDAMWYGMAYGAFLVNSGKTMDREAFHKAFSKKMFGMVLDKNMNDFLTRWTYLHLDRRFFEAVAREDLDILNDPGRIPELEDIRARSAEVLSLCPKNPPPKNPDVLASMCLSAEIMYVFSEGLLILAGGEVPQQRRELWKTTASDVITRAEEDWDRGRYPDDPAKFKAKFPNQTGSHLLILLRELQRQVIIY